MHKTILFCLALVISLIVLYRLGNYSISKTSTTYEELNITKQQKNIKFDEDNIKILSWSPRVFLYQNFLSHEECDHIIKLGESKLSRSLVGDGSVSPHRTSYGTFLSKEANDPVIKSVAEKISMWTQLPIENGESFYLLRYENGQEYKAHPDYFSRSRVGKEGNRFATVLTYLSDVEEGGETFFPKINLEIKPKKGEAVLFWNLHLNGTEDSYSLHGGRPVIKGTKWCMTKWIRQFKYR